MEPIVVEIKVKTELTPAKRKIRGYSIDLNVNGEFVAWSWAYTEEELKEKMKTLLMDTIHGKI